MLLKKYVKTRRKVKIFLLLAIVVLLVVTIIVLGSTGHSAAIELLLDERFIARAYRDGDTQQQQQNQERQPSAVALLQSKRDHGVIVPEKYNEQQIKARIIQSRLDHMRQQQQQQQQRDNEVEQSRTTLDVVTTAVHIFYTANQIWYKSKKPSAPPPEHPNDVPLTTPKPVKILNTAFYPALGLYKPSSSLLSQHFENIRSCGIGVLILSFPGSSAKPADTALLNQIIELAPQHNLSVTFELSVAGNQSVEFVRQQLQDISTYAELPGFYRVYSQSRRALMPVLYVSNAYKLSDSLGRLLCRQTAAQLDDGDGLRRILDAFFIGHIRLKSHLDVMRRLCFDGFYSKLPSNGAVFASTWKNWSYLKSYALSYKMLFVPTVGPGFAERNKFPRHGDIQRHRSNGRYYGVAWRTAILNHLGFINIASYNNWPDGSQIEEVIPRAGFLDYNPGTKTKYLDLTAHWVGNFLKTRQEAAMTAQNCYELLNQTIC
ncbi:glycoprotein endo-alpha-1,2-mannosidase [Drosophila tropicalis]|uniref:glycoprotein endo-alpha-1,2-mannosidase n=1 Tax=Drosophila tropicalis TaxID=46794 RepID=UPI0035AC18DF